MNNKPFSHVSRYGTEFVAERCDFATGVTVKHRPRTRNLFASDVSEMIGYHAVNIRPELNGFAGYDCINFNLK